MLVLTKVENRHLHLCPSFSFTTTVGCMIYFHNVWWVCREKYFQSKHWYRTDFSTWDWHLAHCAPELRHDTQHMKRQFHKTTRLRFDTKNKMLYFSSLSLRCSPTRFPSLITVREIPVLQGVDAIQPVLHDFVWVCLFGHILNTFILPEWPCVLIWNLTLTYRLENGCTLFWFTNEMLKWCKIWSTKRAVSRLTCS